MYLLFTFVGTLGGGWYVFPVMENASSYYLCPKQLGIRLTSRGRLCFGLIFWLQVSLGSQDCVCSGSVNHGLPSFIFLQCHLNGCHPGFLHSSKSGMSCDIRSSQVSSLVGIFLLPGRPECFFLTPYFTHKLIFYFLMPGFFWAAPQL